MVDRLSSQALVVRHDQAYWYFATSDEDTPYDLFPTNNYLIASTTIYLFNL